MHSYAWLSRLGSGVFLVVQMIILLDFAYLWSEDWVNREHVGWLVGLLVSTLVLYAGSITLVVFLFRWYVPAGVPGGCARNAWLVSSSLVPCALFTAVGFHPSARSGAVLPSAVVTAYCIYLCYGALASEPATYACNPHAGEARTRPAEAVERGDDARGVGVLGASRGIFRPLRHGREFESHRRGQRRYRRARGPRRVRLGRGARGGRLRRGVPGGTRVVLVLVVPRQVAAASMCLHDARGMGRR